MKTFQIFILALSVLLSVSCSTGLKPIALTSTPPQAQIKLKEKAEWGGGLLKKYIFQEGIYTAYKENQKGYLYQAPGSITVKDFPLTYGGTGGLFWPKDADAPNKVYVKSLGQYIYFTPKKQFVFE